MKLFFRKPSTRAFAPNAARSAAHDLAARRIRNDAAIQSISFHLPQAQTHPTRFPEQKEAL
jgi:hypothetical protein